MALSSPEQPLLRLSGVAKRYGKVEAVRPLDLAIDAGDFFAILGPSGCGKTTLLRMIGGFMRPSTGRIAIDGRDVTTLSPERRPTNMVFQGYGLFPHMNVRQNIGYGLRLARVPDAELRARVNDILRLGRIEDLAGRGVGGLSGGQQQRVALARALVMRPRVLLLDEPLAALDLKLRQAMQEELRRLHREIGGTFVFVTHDQNEAMALANRIAVMQAGRVVQEGTPEAIYDAPADRFVAGFVGEANFLAGRRAGGIVTLAAGGQLESPGPDGPVTAMVRPERLAASPAVTDASHATLAEARDHLAFAATVEDRVFLGDHVRLTVRLADGTSAIVHRVAAGALATGDRVTIRCAAADARVLADG